MVWSLVWGLVTGVGAIGTWATLGSSRFERRFARDAKALLTTSPPLPQGAASLELGRLAPLPAPVREYLTQALGDSPQRVQSVRFRHGGRFRSKLEGPWQHIRGQQYNTTDPPAFLWWGRLSPVPGVWVDARDRSIGGKGNMVVSLESTLTLFDRAGRELDQGALLRLLSDFVLFPSVMLDERYVGWTPIDERHARASLRVQGSVVSGVFEFGDDGLARSFHSERYLDTGAGEPRLLPWSGDYDDYRRVHGLLVPHHFVGYWHVDGERIPYVDFTLEPPEYDVRDPFS
ncbi:MAG TPA: DUF6544 family protein [Polyangiaceae bacterium]|nr:DUF6544 family protein [Polyangiaceae bacterium]